jgi:hypothetical protein
LDVQVSIHVRSAAANRSAIVSAGPTKEVDVNVEIGNEHTDSYAAGRVKEITQAATDCASKIEFMLREETSQ